LAATAVLIAISSWNEFLFRADVDHSQGISHLAVGLQLMVGEYQLAVGLLTAGASSASRRFSCSLRSSSARSFFARSDAGRRQRLILFRGRDFLSIGVLF